MFIYLFIFFEKKKKENDFNWSNLRKKLLRGTRVLDFIGLDEVTVTSPVKYRWRKFMDR